MANTLKINLLRPMNKILNFFTIKKLEALGLSLIASISAFFLPVFPFIALALALVYIDYWGGKRAAIAMNQKLIEANDPAALAPEKVITSSGKRRTIDKAISYGVAIVFSEAFWQLFIYSLPLPMDIQAIAMQIKIPTYCMSFIVCKVEYLSYLENVEKITGNRELLPFVKDLMKKTKMPK